MSRKQQRTATEDTSFSPEEFDPQPAAAAAIQTVADSTKMPLDDQLAARAEEQQERPGRYSATVKKKEFKRAPDPLGEHLIDLSNDPEGPRARLLRSNDNQAMLIQFSENPGKEITKQIADAGFRWESRASSDFAKGAWVIDLEQGREWRNHALAQETFREVINQIREKAGMDPFVPGAGVA